MSLVSLRVISLLMGRWLFQTSSIVKLIFVFGIIQLFFVVDIRLFLLRVELLKTLNLVHQSFIVCQELFHERILLVRVKLLEGKFLVQSIIYTFILMSTD